MKLYNAITMYHGSDTKFDKFEYEFIDTGKNGHAHGWGVYLAANKSVSEGYRPSEEITVYDGKTIPEHIKEKGIDCPYFDVFYEDNSYKLTIDKLVKKLTRRIETVKVRNDNGLANQLEQILEIINNLGEGIVERKGMLATVELPDDIVLAEERVPLNQQSEFIQNVCKKVFTDDFGEETYYDLNTFKNLSNQLEPIISNSAIRYLMLNIFSKSENIDYAIFEHPSSLKRSLSFILKSYNITNITVDELYDTLKSFAEQSKVIKDKGTESLQKTFKQLYDQYSDKEASLALCANGIDGMLYEGKIDQGCVVLYNLEKAKIISKE